MTHLAFRRALLPISRTLAKVAGVGPGSEVNRNEPMSDRSSIQLHS
jgi:hypothetical protein